MPNAQIHFFPSTAYFATHIVLHILCYTWPGTLPTRFGKMEVMEVMDAMEVMEVFNLRPVYCIP